MCFYLFAMDVGLCRVPAPNHLRVAFVSYSNPNNVSGETEWQARYCVPKPLIIGGNSLKLRN